MSILEKKAAIHGPSYGCENDSCRDEQSFPARELFWVEAGESDHCEKWEEGWYCDYCAHSMLDNESYPARLGQSLADFLESQR